jgi:hypothetical protein
MNKDKLNNMFGEGEDISQDMIILYYEGKLSPKDMHRVEKYLAEDEFSEEAMEGLSLLDNKQKLSPAILEINRRIYEKAKANKPKLLVLHPSVKYAIAATFLLLLGVAFFFNFFLKNLPEKDVAENKAAEKNTGETPVPEATLGERPDEKQESLKQAVEKAPGQVGPERDALHEKKGEGQPVQASNQLSEEAAKDVPAVADNKGYTETESVLDESKKSIDANLSSGKAKMVTKESDKDARGEAIADDNEQEKLERAAPEKKADTRTDSKNRRKSEEKSNRNEPIAASPSAAGSTISSENRARWEEDQAAGAKTKLAMSREALKKDPGNDEALFYAGISCFTLKDYKGATGYFDELIPKKQSQYYEDALYQKALVLVAENKKKEAKKLLKQLVDMKGRKESDARKKLEELK